MFNPASLRRGTNHVALKLVTPPTVEPISMTELKSYGRIAYNNSDSDLNSFIVAARQSVESFLRRSLITQTWDMILDWGPAWIELPRPPLQTIVGVYYTDLGNVEHTVDTSTYFFDTNSNFLSLVIGGVWPLHRGHAGFRVRFTSGYGDTGSAVPEEIRRQIKALAATSDLERGTIMQPSMQAVLRPYRVEGLPYRLAPGWAAKDIEG